MKKLSNIKEDENKPEGSASDALWSGKYLSVWNINDWEVVNEKDMTIVIPYFVDRGIIALRYEHVPTYTFRTPSQTNFITILSGSIEQGESAQECAIRELKEEAGIILNNDYKLELLCDPIHVSKGNTAKYHIFLLEINEGEYSIIEPSGDGSESEKLSKTIFIDIDTLNNIKPNDLITEYCLTKLKEKTLTN